MITSFVDTPKFADIAVGQRLYRAGFQPDGTPFVLSCRVVDKRGPWLTLQLPDGALRKEQGCRWYKTHDDAIYGEVSLAAHVHVQGECNDILDRIIRLSWLLNR